MQTTDTKETILEETFHLLLSKGYDGVSISDIQLATGISRGLLYHYFGNKEALFVEVTQKYLVNLFRLDSERVRYYTIEEMTHYMVEKYSEICATSCKKLTEGSGNGIMNYDFLFYRVMQESEDFAKKYQEVREEELKTWETVLIHSHQQGILRTDIDLKKTARYFVYLMDGVWMNAVNNKSGVHLIDDLKDVLQSFCLLLKK